MPDHNAAVPGKAGTQKALRTYHRDWSNDFLDTGFRRYDGFG